jgi:hypothetical protein
MGWKVLEGQEAKGSRYCLISFRELILRFNPFNQHVVLAWRWQVGDDVVGLSVFLFLIISAPFATLFPPVIPSIYPLKATFCAPSRVYRSWERQNKSNVLSNAERQEAPSHR